MSKNQSPSIIIEGSYKNARFLPGLSGNNPAINFDGFEDSGWWYDSANSAMKCRMAGSDVLQLVGGLVTVFASAVVYPVSLPVYGVSIALTGQANIYIITANNGTAFLVNAPAVAVLGQEMTITIRNTSGGVLGVLSFAAGYKAAAWVQPANGFSRSIKFQFDGTNWVEIFRTPADVPN